MFVSKTYSIIDAKYYADYSKIKSTWTKDTSVSGRTIYNYLNAFTEDVEVIFKFNSIPSSFVVGLGRLSGGINQLKFNLMNYNNSPILFYSTNSQSNIQESITGTLPNLMKFTTENLHKVSLYYEDTIKAIKDTNTNMPLTLRIDDFTATPLDLEYVIVL